MHQSAKSEVVVVTGASAGLGRAIAREFGRHGASVGLISRNQERLDAAKKEIEQTGGSKEEHANIMRESMMAMAAPF